MASVIDICNRALDKLGSTPIISLEDGTSVANLCLRAWPLTRDQVLRDHPWNFAVKRVTLSPLTDEPTWGFGYQHQLPADFLRLLEVHRLPPDQYQLEGRTILANSTELNIRYIYRVTDPNQYDPLFLEAVATRLAFEMCESITQSNSKKEIFWNEYDDILTRARRVDGQENPLILLEEDDWIRVRY